jgi:hypothetical protein
LGHPHLLTDRGVTQSTRTDFTGDHLIGVQSHAQPKVDPVAVFDFSGQSGGLPLNAQRRKTTAERAILIAPGAPNTAMIPVNCPPFRRNAAQLQMDSAASGPSVSRVLSG